MIQTGPSSGSRKYHEYHSSTRDTAPDKYLSTVADLLVSLHLKSHISQNQALLTIIAKLHDREIT